MLGECMQTVDYESLNVPRALTFALVAEPPTNVSLESAVGVAATQALARKK